MAQHVDEIIVFERKLRPIYDSLDAGFNKKALQEVDKLLKKNPKLNCAKALKAFALLRLNREEESNAILQTLLEEKPHDDATLQVLTFCYKEIGQFDKICELYCHAVKLTPGDEELLAHLFMAYVRLNDYKNQQATALQLYKIKQKSPYYFWAVMSVVLQAVRGPESKSLEKKKVFLALAQRMIDKFITDDKLDAEQGVQLYVNILQLQEKFSEALDFIDGPICKKLYPGAPISIKIGLLKKLEKWNDLNDLLKELLSNERDRWDYYKEYIRTCFEIYKKLESSEVKKTEIMESCLEFLSQLIEAGKRVRGPYLARLELYRKMREHNVHPEDLLGDYTDLIVEYFRLFGDKPCCTNDIALFLDCIDFESRKNLATRLLLESGVNSSTLPLNKEQMQKHICSLQISRMCGIHNDLPTVKLISLYTEFKQHYDHGFNQFGKGLLPTDMGPSDAYALLAAHVMFDISTRNQRSHELFETLCLLYHVLQNSPSNFHAKLLCLKIFHYFGCVVGAQQIYETLDIKNVQLDSMCYLHCSLLPSYGASTTAKAVYDSTLRFFTTSYKERYEYIIMSYKFGSFSKLEEIMDFQARLSNSLHYATVWVEKFLLELVCMSGTVTQNLNAYKIMGLQPEDDRINWDDIADNRDLSVVAQWDPICEQNNVVHEVFKQDIELLRIRSLLLRFISSIVDLLHFSHKIKSLNCVKTPKTSTVELLKHSWEQAIQSIRSKNYEKTTPTFLVTLLPSRLHLMLEIPYEKFFSNLSQIILNLYTGSDLKDDIVQGMNNLVTSVASYASKILDIQNCTDDPIWIQRTTQETVVAVVEIFALYAFILSITHEKIVMCSNTQHSKKNKRKDGQDNLGDNNAMDINPKQGLNMIVQLMKHLKQELLNLDGLLGNWRQSQAPSQNKNSIIEEMAKLSVDSATVSTETVTAIFQENHTQVIKELRNVIKDKIRMINK